MNEEVSKLQAQLAALQEAYDREVSLRKEAYAHLSNVISVACAASNDAERALRDAELL